MKIRHVGAELFNADRRTDRHMTKLIIAFRYFTKAPKNVHTEVPYLQNDKISTVCLQ
jgi:hypothetical protein